MQILEMILISLQITAMFARKKYKKYRAESDESIENLIYYKDCKKGNKDRTTTTTTTTPAVNPQSLMYRAPSASDKFNPSCPCPRMCCSMRCDCGGPEGSQSFVSHQTGPTFNEFSDMRMSHQNGAQHQPNIPNMPMSVQPQIQKNFRGKKMKTMNPEPSGDFNLPPIGSRRTFTRENIKTLLAKDEEIRKILKELVKVTMHKVDLVKAANTRRNMMTESTTPESEASSNESYEEDDGKTILIED